MRFDINILGCGSATPTIRHNPSGQVVNFRDKLFMIDCGEGSQLMFKRMGLKLSRMNHIFISHLHGDHCFGLPGLLSTMVLKEKGGVVTVHLPDYGSEVLERMIRWFCPTDGGYELRFEKLPRKGLVYEDQSLTIETFPLYHRVPCHGFIFREKPPLLNLKGDMVRFHQVPVSRLPDIKAGANFVKPDGTVIPNKMLTQPPVEPLSYAYCSDTLFDERVARSVEGINTIYHEATYDTAQEAKAKARGHSTARQAATIAKMAGAKRLIIGHYSNSIRDLNLLLNEAREVFPDTFLANEGKTFSLRD